MCEFEPINFFPQPPKKSILQTVKDLPTTYEQNNIDSSPSTNHHQCSSDHNIVKQIVITIRKMMDPHLTHLVNTTDASVIKLIWQIFMNQKPNKKLLIAVFSKRKNIKLMKSYGLLKLESDFGKDVYNEGVELLREQIIRRLKPQQIKSHLLDRRLNDKSRLLANLLYFLQQELKNGHILQRKGIYSTKKVEQLLRNLQKQEQMLECYFNQEVSERSASINNEISW